MLPEIWAFLALFLDFPFFYKNRSHVPTAYFVKRKEVDLAQSDGLGSPSAYGGTFRERSLFMKLDNSFDRKLGLILLVSGDLSTRLYFQKLRPTGTFDRIKSH